MEVISRTSKMIAPIVVVSVVSQCQLIMALSTIVACESTRTAFVHVDVAQHSQKGYY